ncbi:MAG: DUF1501 domain-containing protein [Gemmataceae bacterium]|nr:DUF1501 domain-containing protein [Gemmataceae bacterium]
MSTSMHTEPLPSRRDLLLQGGAGFGALALSYLLKGNPLFAQPPAAVNPLAPKPPHLAPRATSVIFLFMEGGPSSIDLFDPKPLLNRLAGQKLPSHFRPVITPMGESDAPLLASRRRWARHGSGGLWVSDWYPHVATCADDLAVIRSCWANGLNHSNGVCQMNTGSTNAGRPSLGAWVTYGLGTENQNLPAFVVIQDNAAQVTNGPRNWGAGFMPAVFQGTRLQAGTEPIANLNPPPGISAEQQRGRIELLNHFNRQHQLTRAQQTELDARIASYELAFRMQAHAPEAVDIAGETEATRRLYGMDERETAVFGRNCLLARRLVERGVRFVQLYHGAGSKWDAHARIEANHTEHCRSSDKPIAGLLKDLKRRGLLESTLVIWGGEFGRTPMSEKGDGRDHNPYGFTMWLAGGGVRGGQTIGSTDEVGLHAVEDRLHVHDFHATILWLLGIDNLRLTYRYKGRPENPTINEGEAYRRIVG